MGSALFVWKIMEDTIRHSQKFLRVLLQCREQFFERKNFQILCCFRRDGEEVVEEIEYLLDVPILNFCDSRVDDVGIEIERDVIAVDKVRIHFCIVPVIILLGEILWKWNGCLRFFDINRCNFIPHICNFSIRIIKFHNLRNKILEKFPVNIKMKIISQHTRIRQKRTVFCRKPCKIREYHHFFAVKRVAEMGRFLLFRRIRQKISDQEIIHR